MKRIALPLIAMAFSSPVFAQDADPGAWQGYYAGLQLDSIQDGALVSDLGGGLTAEIELDSIQFVFFGGYRHQIGNFVVGGEYDLAASRTDLVGFGGSTKQTVHRLGVELGYAAGRFLPYASAGLAHIRYNGDGGTFTDTGSFAAVGLDYRLRERSTLGVEVINHEFGELSGGFTFPITPELTTVGVNFSVDF
ncbi:MAG: outer membrane beta-barrel protein [Pseudomonadota bacterium]